MLITVCARALAILIKKELNLNSVVCINGSLNAIYQLMLYFFGDLNMNKQLLVFALLLVISNALIADVTEETAQMETTAVLQDQDTIKLNEQLARMNAQLAELSGQTKTAKATGKRNNTEKAPVEVLLGKLKVFYKVANVDHTDSIEVDEVYQSPERGYVGFDNKQEIICTYKDFSDLNLPVSSQFDYLCLNVSDPNPAATKWYFFTLLNDGISKGFYAIGDGTDVGDILRLGIPLNNMTGYKVPAPNPVNQMDCIFNTIEKTYPAVFSPAAQTQLSAPYTYRYYSKVDSYIGFSSVDSHLYLLGASKKLSEHGTLQRWAETTNCE